MTLVARVIYVGQEEKKIKEEEKKEQDCMIAWPCDSHFHIVYLCVVLARERFSNAAGATGERGRKAPQRSWEAWP